jgi:hypothetical protein
VTYEDALAALNKIPDKLYQDVPEVIVQVRAQLDDVRELFADNPNEPPSGDDPNRPPDPPHDDGVGANVWDSAGEGERGTNPPADPAAGTTSAAAPTTMSRAAAAPRAQQRRDSNRLDNDERAILTAIAAEHTTSKKQNVAMGMKPIISRMTKQERAEAFKHNHQVSVTLGTLRRRNLINATGNIWSLTRRGEKLLAEGATASDGMRQVG